MRAFIVCGLVLLFLTAAFSAEERLDPAAPSVLAHTSREMKTAGFWISRHPSPDDVIMTPERIAAFNARIQNDQKLTKDIFKVMGTALRYGIITRYTDQRFSPTAEGLYDQADDIDFDQLQNSTLDVGTPVAVVRQSPDKQWFYVLGADSDGWVKASNVAVGDMKTVQEYALAQNFIVVTAPKADIFADKARTQWVEYARMGTRLALVTLGPDTVEVKIPASGKEGQLTFMSGYMNAEDVHPGYLTFSPRMLIKQALRMLNTPYGWGGMYGEQDCSAFMQEIFSTVGVHLPRDSKNQALVGREVTGPLSTAVAGITLLPMKGHIMLYLGMVDGRPYAIHEIWAYRQDKGGEDVARVLNRVVVSDLSLGQGSRRGSLLKRLSGIREVRE